MSSYLTFYGRLNPKRYKVELLEKSDYKKQEDVVCIASFCRSSKIYQVVNGELDVVWAGDEEKYTTLTSEKIQQCINAAKESIESYKRLEEKECKSREYYIQYLKGMDILSYSDFLEKLEDYDNTEVKDEIEELNTCINYLYFLQEITEESSYGGNAFSEILCNID